MKSTSKIPWPRIFAEGAAIVVSILLAFSIQAWWDKRIQDEQLQGHLAALNRDFDQMHEGAMASYTNAKRAVNSGIELMTGISTRKDWHRETAVNLLVATITYEVFSPSIGGYEALISSGSVEFLTSNTLKRELAAFFGSFEDTRSSEQILITNLAHFWRSPEFGQIVGVHRMPIPGFPEFDMPPVEGWNDSEYFVNMIAVITLDQMDVMEDYQSLLERIDSIRVVLTEEARID